MSNELIEKIESQKQQALSEIEEIKSQPTDQALESWRIKYLGRKGFFPKVLSKIGELPENQRKEVGQAANSAKTKLQEKYSELQNQISEKERVIDPTFPGTRPEIGHTHPIYQVIKKITDDFKDLGFVTTSGPEAETEQNNFDLLNIPPNHPARDEWDTFWLKNPGTLLRTHTSPVQIRYMKNHEPPVRILVPGRVYRYETEDASHTSVFHQIEGLVIGKDINLPHLKAIIDKFVESALGEHETRMRPSFFPFTEPSFEVDVKFGNKWLELMGCGLVDPEVLKNMDLDPDEYSGLAFGAGVERIVMTKHGINDIRKLFDIDPHFLNQF